MEKKEISKATIERMPQYLRYLRLAFESGKKYASSADIAENINVSAVLVRKDLSRVSSVSGKPRKGFEIQRLIGDIEKFLGYDNLSDAVVVGAGGLGKAFLGYDRFKKHGLNIVAAFDIDSSIIGKEISGKRIYPMEKLVPFVQENHIRIGILTVPKTVAKDTLDLLVSAGVKGVGNFAATKLKAPTDVVVKTEDLSASLALLAGELILREGEK